MKINIKFALIITAALIVPLTLSNCIIAIDASESPKEQKLLELEKARIKGTINNSQYNTQKNEIMKTVIP
jgi:hypothetical protein